MPGRAATIQALRREMLRSLEESHDAFYVGYQLVDDLLDWRIDYGRKQYSYLLTEGLFGAGWQGRAESGHRPSAAAVGEMLSRSGVAEQVRLLALDYFDKAEHLIGGMPDGSWQAAIRSTRNRVRRLAFESKDATASAPSAEPGRREVGGGLRTMNWGMAAPISASWCRWLDPTRGFAIAEPSILDEQRGVSSDAGPSTVGMAVCEVGLAIHASVRALPQFDLAAHIGMSVAELEWCRDHDAWLSAMLVCTVDEQALAWTADREHPRFGSEWVPPAVGRYLGFRLVRDFLSDDPDAADVHPDAVLDHFLRRSVT